MAAQYHSCQWAGSLNWLFKISTLYRRHLSLAKDRKHKYIFIFPKIDPQPQWLMPACLELLYLIHVPVLLDVWCVMSGWNMWNRVAALTWNLDEHTWFWNMNSMFILCGNCLELCAKNRPVVSAILTQPHLFHGKCLLLWWMCLLWKKYFEGIVTKPSKG